MGWIIFCIAGPAVGWIVGFIIGAIKDHRPTHHPNYTSSTSSTPTSTTPDQSSVYKDDRSLADKVDTRLSNVFRNPWEGIL
jgi:hypothetical protein